MVCSERREDRPSSLKESAKATNFLELRKAEVRRTSLLGTSFGNRLGWLVLDGVLQRHDPRLVCSAASQLNPEALRRRVGRQQRDALPEQNGHHGDFDGIYHPSLQEAAEERAATEEPDVLTRLRPEVGQRLLWVLGHYGEVRIVLLAQRPREDDRLHSWQSAAPCSSYGLKRPASQEERVELIKECSEVDVRVHDDPVRFAVGSRDVAVQAHRNHVANPSHRSLP